MPSQPSGASIFDRIVERAQGRNEESSSPSESEGGGGGSGQRVITLYRNGFIVDDGPFRDITAPENHVFIKALEEGRVPAG